MTKPKEVEVKIKDIVVKISGKEYIFTVEEAKKLKNALIDIFGKEIVRETKIIHETVPSCPRPHITWPIYTSQKDDWYEDIYKVTCEAGFESTEKGFIANSNNTLRIEFKD